MRMENQRKRMDIFVWDTKMSDKWAQNRIALITGATSGFGNAIARRVLSAGGKVIAIGRRIERLRELENEFPGQVYSIAIDLRELGALKIKIAEIPSEFANIDILINNAGLALGLKGAHEAEFDDWETMIDTNIKSLVFLTNLLLPKIVTLPRGDIINLGSVAGSYPYPGGNVYGATKAFVHQFSLNLRADLLGKNVRVTSIEPGMCETEFSLVRFSGDKEKAAKVYEGVKPLSADDVALAIESVLKLPAHININRLELMPIQQAFSPFAVDRKL